MSVTNHSDTRSKRAGLWGYLGDFTAFSTPALYDPWRVSMEASLRGISCSESDICLRMLGRVSGRENCAWRKAEEAEAENAVMVLAFGPQAKHQPCPLP